ncbi:FAD-binding and (Fe-S)-binding domain-containing protein [Paucidesulfovibrio longus]|uniref:FAD-binding and (Fe-S)-binding domain-containing protein n=1 Tax=Paucidesulfovibrio longus TaxID=889 RepID=UPI0003B30143|nr:FAD-binding and (Fe-S)-binding domain-containing protein [Paucidesulfovibrio longus]
MPETGPHISIPDEDLLTKILGVTDLEQVAHWPDAVRKLAASLAAELFLVRYNPFVDPALVKKSVSRRLDMSRPMLSGEYPKILTEAIREFWDRYEADRRFREQVMERLKAVLPSNAIGSSPHLLVESATDATDLRLELPMLVLFPESEAEVQGVVRLAGEMGFSLIPRGGGTGLTGGAVPIHGRTAVLSLTRMNRIVRVDEDSRILCAQTGVLTMDAIRAAAERNLLLTVDPASKMASSLGGNVAENAGGPFAFEYGTTIDNLFSYRMVTPQGEIIQVSRKDHPRHKIFEGDGAEFEIRDEAGELIRNVRLRGDELRKPGLGKDVSNKFLGGLPGVQKEGVDGVITEACFVLHPRPAFSRTLCLEFFGRSMRNAMLVINDVVALRNRIREQGDLVKISALEEFGSKYVQAIEYVKKSQQYEGDPISVLLLQLDSDHQQALDEAVDTVVSLAQPYDGVDIFAARDEREAELFWEDRHKLSAIAKRTSGFKVNEDVVIPLQAIPDFADYLENLNLKYLALAYRRALSRATALPGVEYADPRIVEAKARVEDILAGRVTAATISDVEQEAQIRYLFQALRDAYPKQDRELKAVFERLLATRVVIANHMHAGDGNCHVNLPVNSNDADMLAEAHRAAREVFEHVLKLGGEVSGEHGIGITKIAFQAQSKIDALRAYKAEVDPKGVLNPGKLTSRKLPGEPYTFSFNRLIHDLDDTALKDREHLTELLKNVQTCTRCGKCKQVCPMYYPQQGLEAHPRNKNISLGALIEAVYYSQLQLGEPAPELLDRLRALMDHCTACGKCTSVCPVKIDSAGAALSVRAFLDYKGKSGHALKGKVLSYLAKDPAARLPMAAKAFSLGQSIANKGLGLIPGIWRRRMISPVFQGPGPALDFTNLAQELRLAERNVFKSADAPADRTVIYFPGCGGGLFSRSIGQATLYLLLKSGVNVVLPEQHLCCGYPLLSAGAAEAYKTNRHRTRQALIDTLITTGRSGLKATVLLTACGTCRESLESYDLSGELVEPLKHMDAMQYLHELGGLDLAAPETAPLYHAACHAEWVGQPKAKAPEIYRAAFAGLIDAQVSLSPGCCGESGTGAVTSPEIYNRVRHRKQKQMELDLEGFGRERPVVVGCPSCKSGIKRSLIQMGRANPVLHTVEYLARLAGGPKWKRELKAMLDSGEARGRSLTVGRAN